MLLPFETPVRREPFVPVDTQWLSLAWIAPIVCHVTLPGNNFWLSIAVQVYERHCVCLRPAIVDHVLAPTAFATRCLLLLKPENAVVMAQTGEQIRKFVAIDVH